MACRHLSAVLLLAMGINLADEPTPGDAVPAVDDAMEALAWKSGCFNCHDLREHIRGPAWTDVAARYRGDETALERLVETVRNGGRGNWGDDAMTPNRRVPEEDIRTLVTWLLELE